MILRADAGRISETLFDHPNSIRQKNQSVCVKSGYPYGLHRSFSSVCYRRSNMSISVPDPTSVLSITYLPLITEFIVAAENSEPWLDWPGEQRWEAFPHCSKAPHRRVFVAMGQRTRMEPCHLLRPCPCATGRNNASAVPISSIETLEDGALLQ
jgi:hypothetical protein